MTALLASVPWWQTTLVQAFGFLVLFGILYRWVFPFVGKILGIRRKDFHDTFERLDREEKESADRLAEVNADLDRKEAQGERRIMKALEEGARAKETALKEARKNSKAILDRAVRDVDIERDKAILQLRNEITRLTLRASREVVSKLVTPEVHARLVKKYLAELEGVRR
jgi:F-type H+-transporting ATPase subunit b